MNPPVLIEEYPMPQGFWVNVIRDDVLPGGTKQRALYKLIEGHSEKEFIYAGPATGYAQIAVAYCCQQLGRRAVLFLQSPGGKETPLSRKAKSYDGRVTIRAVKLADIQEIAKEYARKHPEAFLLPLGLDSAEFSRLLLEQLTEAIPKDVVPRRLWIAVGSGTLLRVLAKRWPTTTFMPVRVGLNMWEDQYDPEVWDRIGGRTRIDTLTAPQRFFEPVQWKLLPPYPSIASYDAKIWQMLLKYGEEGDYVWNVGAT